MRNGLKCPGCGMKPKLNRVFLLDGHTSCRLCHTEIIVSKRAGTWVARKAK